MQTEIYPPQDHSISTKGNQCGMEKTVIESISQWRGQSSSGMNWPHDGQGQKEESRFDLFIICLQWVINRPELKQHLKYHKTQGVLRKM